MQAAAPVAVAPPPRPTPEPRPWVQLRWRTSIRLHSRKGQHYAENRVPNVKAIDNSTQAVARPGTNDQDKGRRDYVALKVLDNLSPDFFGKF